MLLSTESHDNFKQIVVDLSSTGILNDNYLLKQLNLDYIIKIKFMINVFEINSDENIDGLDLQSKYEFDKISLQVNKTYTK